MILPTGSKSKEINYHGKYKIFQKIFKIYFFLFFTLSGLVNNFNDNKNKYSVKCNFSFQIHGWHMERMMGEQANIHARTHAHTQSETFLVEQQLDKWHFYTSWLEHILQPLSFMLNNTALAIKHIYPVVPYTISFHLKTLLSS